MNTSSLYVVAFEPRDEFFLQDYLQGSDPGSARTFYTDSLAGARRFKLQSDAAFMALLLGGRVQRIVIDANGEVKPALMPITKRAPIAERTVTSYEYEDMKDIKRNI